MGTISLPKDVEDKLSEYRKRRMDETGKRPYRDTAIIELLRKSLDGVEPPKPIWERITEIEQRLQTIERQIES